MKEKSMRRAAWIAVVLAWALMSPAVVAEPPADTRGWAPPTGRWSAGGWLDRVVARASEQLEGVWAGFRPEVEATDQRAAHHLTIEPGGDPLPPPVDDQPPGSG